MNFSIDIPRIFYSSKDDKPISHCAMCGQSVFSSKEPYIIEKAYKKNPVTKEDEVIFEYALCHKCQQNSSKELSTESVKNIQMYFDLYVDFEKRQKELLQPGNFQFTECVKNCIITNKPIKECDEYQIGALFIGNKLLLDQLPFAIGEKAIEELQEVLSKKTKDYLDGFKDRILPVDIRDKVPDDFLILI